MNFSKRKKVRKLSDWIPVEQRLPEEYPLEDLEVTTSDHKRNVGFYRPQSNQWFENTTYKELEGIAWKGPSEPYGKENTERI